MKNQTVVIYLGDRFFCRFGKGRSVQTAWSLGGAALFQLGCNNDLLKIMDELLAKKKYPVARYVNLGDIADLGGAI